MIFRDNLQRMVRDVLLLSLFPVLQAVKPQTGQLKASAITVEMLLLVLHLLSVL